MTIKRTHPYESFACILSYPWTGERAKVATALDEVAAAYPEEGKALSPLRDFVRESSESRLQELYTHTFEIHPLCYLDVGYVLFGEDYKRGELLVHLNREHEKAANPCGMELADHLPNLLRLLAKLQGNELAGELSRVFLEPALEKMLPGFKEKGNVYGAALQALQRVLLREFPAAVSGPAFREGAGI